MFTIETIQSYYPPSQTRDKRQILREYLQCLMLDGIFASEFAFKLSFLGGTALRIIHGCPRFSEDLDFDNFGLTEEEFLSVGSTVKLRLEEEGYEVETSFVHKGAFRCNVRLPHILFEQKISPLESEKILIQIDSTAHGYTYQPDVQSLQRFGLNPTVRVTPKNILLAQKFNALFNRPRVLGRDFFDIAYLLSFSIKPDYDYLNYKIGVGTSNELRAKTISFCETLDFEKLAEDVASFSYSESDLNKVRHFSEIIKSASL